MRYYQLLEGIREDALEKGLPVTVSIRAQELYDKVSSDPNRLGDTDVVDGYWIETHTHGCRNHADDPEDSWMSRHWEIYDEYKNDGISIVLGDPSDGVFVTITPQY